MSLNSETEDRRETCMEEGGGGVKISEDFSQILSLLLCFPQTGETRMVSHINFTTWPDHGVPKVDRCCIHLQYI